MSRLADWKGVGHCPTPRQEALPLAPGREKFSLYPRHVCDVPKYDGWSFSKTTETQGMGTVERPEGPNGEVPRPLRSIRVFVENFPSRADLTGRQEMV